MDENTSRLLMGQKKHLASLLEAMQRCVYFLNASDLAVDWPLTGAQLQSFTPLHCVSFNTAVPTFTFSLKGWILKTTSIALPQRCHPRSDKRA